MAANGSTPGTNDFAFFHNTNNEAYIVQRGAFGLHLQTNSVDRLVISSAGAIRFNAYGSGAITSDASGNLTAVSDERAKRDIRPFVRGLADVLKLRPILHGYTLESGLDQTKTDYVGFSAQDVQKIIPEAVGNNLDGTLSLADRAILAAVVNAVQELERRL